IRADDGPRIVDLHSRLSEQSIYFRFFAPYPVLSARDLERFTHVDYDDRVALVGTVAGAIVGVVRYDRLTPGGDEAEVAFTVRDDYQGLGVGSVLLEHLTGVARERGIRRFIAEVLPANHRMLGVFRDAGYASAMAMEDGVVRLDLAIEPTSSSRVVTESREHRAEARSIERLLAPRSVAVVGASRDPRSVGSTLLRNLVESGFTGEVHAVNPHADEPVLGVPTYASVSEIPGTVDLAVVASPAETLLDVVADCATKGVHGLVVVSGGFAETGTEGRERQRRLVRAAHGAGMRVVGPNCLGLINTDPAHLLNASLSPIMPTRGRIGFFSQSGALGIALLETLVRRGLGVSSFVSAGNRADVSGNDLIQFWEEDEDTDVLLLYIESIGNPRKFSRIARRTSRTKPIVAVKSGRSSQGIPLGHRVRSTTLPPSAVDEMFRQSGVIQVDTLGELFDVAMVLTYQPPPGGRRVAVVGNSDALAVLAADASASQGLELTDTEHVLRPDTSAEDFGRELLAAVDDEDVDSVVVLFVPPISDSGEDFAAQISAVSRRATKPMVAIVLAVEGMSELLREVNPDGLPILGSVPTFASVEDGVRALAAVTDYAQWRRRPEGVIPELTDLDRVGAQDVVDRVLEAHPEGGALAGPDLTELLRCYGINVWPTVPVRTIEEALAAGAWLGYPVVLKAADPMLLHRTDLGGVRLDLVNEKALAGAFEAMVESFGSAVTSSLVVQRMARHGVPCVVGATEDALFGPVVFFGVGGVVTELVEDRGYRIPPVSDLDAHELVRAPRAAPLLLGYRGAPAVDTDELEDLIVRVSRLSDDLPELVELELNPVVVAAEGAAVLSASARIAPVLIRADTTERRLPTG
ncbi:MAG TPA: GNAT family N-acetyltransferase, partial [Candidatus Limnocylindria bacterium]|nr:GNAT family N-acetyltransferase [Candidatus Limnocylindria bacterium]